MPSIAKVAFISGAARRIGAEIAKKLHDKGINICLHYNHSASEAKKLCQSLNAQREASAMIVQGDLTEIKQLPFLIEQTIQQWGRLDVLINNASCFYKTKIGEVEEAQWDDLLTTNLKAPFFLAQAALPHLQKTHGSIINIADIHAERPMREYPVYSISKAGLVMLTKALAKELGPHQIRVNAISPGETLWPEGEGNVMTDELKQKIIHRIALKRRGEPLQIAKAVLYFIYDADYVTGQILNIDGGRALYM